MPSAFVLANIAAAYLPCAGLADRADCRLPGGLGEGVCALDTLCDEPEVAACPECNRCLLCGDPCRALTPGAECAMPDGSDGECRQRAECTDDPRFSFDECNHCLPFEGDTCARFDGTAGHWERHGGECPAGGIPDDDLCWECLPGSGRAAKAASGGCATHPADGAAYGAWVLILGAASWSVRRRRAA